MVVILYVYLELWVNLGLLQLLEIHAVNAIL